MTFKATDPIFQSTDKAREYLERLNWPDGPVCPHCGTVNEATALEGKGGAKGTKARKGAYQCNACRKQFSVTVGTVFERSKVPLNKWLLATFMLSSSKKGMSAHQLHRMLGVTYKTAWFMAHRIREAMKPDGKGALGGAGKTVEADETYLGKRNRPSGKSTFITGLGWVSPIPLDSQRKIVALVERGGKARTFHVDRVNRKTVQKILFTNADRESRLMTDEASYYKRPGYQYAEHYSVNHSADEYVRGSAHTNTIEGYFSIFKRGMKGVYQHCGEQHLHRYLCEFDFRYNERAALGVDDTERTNKALQGIVGKRLTYRRTDGAAHA